MSYAPQLEPPIFSTPIRWVLRVLAWLAFAASAYLAWQAVNQLPVAGCDVGAHNGCDEVLASRWSKWLGLPVAVAGLACYAPLAALSVLLGLRNAPASRWINSAFLMLSVVAAGASLWFIAIQVFAIGSFCPFCIVADLCGLAIGAVAIGSVLRWMVATPYAPQPRRADAALRALCTTLPLGAAARGAPIVVTHASPRPSLPIALGGALALLAFLIGGQVIFPGPTFSLENATLDESVELVGSPSPGPANQADASPAQPYVAMRIPSDGEGETSAEPTTDRQAEAPAPDPEDEADPQVEAPAEATAPDDATESESSSPKERLVKFLDGKLTLDVYKHPRIGPPEAPHVMVELVSYDCPHCRKMHRRVEKGRARYGSQMAIIVLPVPLESGCNKLINDPASSHAGACATARFALGVAALRPQSFYKLHNWLMSGDEDKPPSVEKVIPKANDMVDRDRLRALVRGEQLNKQIAEYVNLYARLRTQNSSDKNFGLPVQILGDKVMAGIVENDDDLFTAWEEHLGVKPR